jgi:predicted lipoprotein with Yx(FWY)xxD motif
MWSTRSRDEAFLTYGEKRKELFSMSRKRTTLLAAAGLPVLALAAAGCGGGTSSSPPKTASGKPATVGVTSANLGKILVDSQGRTLYLFTRDHGTTSTCSGACAVNWPPLLASRKATIGNGAKASLVSTTMRGNGKTQLTYHGHPLYLFKNDTKAGQTNGQGLDAFGGLWYAVSPAGSQVTASATSSGGGSGY